jgi:hypothetical protein
MLESELAYFSQSPFFPLAVESSDYTWSVGDRASPKPGLASFSAMHT